MERLKIKTWISRGAAAALLAALLVQPALGAGEPSAWAEELVRQAEQAGIVPAPCRRITGRISPGGSLPS